MEIKEITFNLKKGAAGARSCPHEACHPGRSRCSMASITSNSIT